MAPKFSSTCLVTILFCSLISLTMHAQSGPPPYSIIWINKIGVSTNGDILTKNATTRSWRNSGATSSNILPAYTDGWIEFSPTANSFLTIGFSVNNTIDYKEFSNFILLSSSSSTCGAYEGATITGFGNWQAGDVFRISREGSVVNYYKNGVVIRTVSVNPGLVLKVKTTILEFGRMTPSITASFDGQLMLQSTVTGAEGNVVTGSISMSVTGGTPPYSYSWSSGEQTNSINDKPHGLYTVTVNDAVGREQTRTYDVGYKLNWINKIGVSTNGDIITKNATTRSWRNSGATSSNILRAHTDGWIEFSPTANSFLTIGFSVNNTIDYTDLAILFCSVVHRVFVGPTKGRRSQDLEVGRRGMYSVSPVKEVW